MGLLCFPEFNQYVVGFENPFYPQNFKVSIVALLQIWGYFSREGELGEVFRV
jgi:hypothetical protein